MEEKVYESRRNGRMTEEARKKGIEIGAGVLLYIIAWAATSYWTVPEVAETVLFFLAYAALAATTYWEQLKKIRKKQFIDENLLMIIATLGAFFIGRHKEAVAAMLFYQVGKFVEELSLGRTKKSIAEFIDIRPEYANLKVGNKEKIVPPQELELKQIIVLRPGEKIPVDCVVTQGSGTIDTKALTGESKPRAVKTGDRLYSGSINMNGVLEARVKKLYNDSTAARIMRMVESANENKADSVHFAAKFTRFYTPIVILIALLTVLLPPMMFIESSTEWIYRGLIILVAACPCGLMVSIPMAFLGGIGAASKQGVLIKGGAYLREGRVCREHPSDEPAGDFLQTGQKSGYRCLYRGGRRICRLHPYIGCDPERCIQADPVDEKEKSGHCNVYGR